MIEFCETYHADGVRATVQGLRVGWCKIYPAKDSPGYLRVTQNHSKHGRRHAWYPTYDEAMAAAVQWATRRNRMALKEQST